MIMVYMHGMVWFTSVPVGVGSPIVIIASTKDMHTYKYPSYNFNDHRQKPEAIPSWKFRQSVHPLKEPSLLHGLK